MSRPTRIAALGVLAGLALAGSGCGDDAVRPVALLQMTQPTVVAKKKGPRDLRLRTSLAKPATTSAAPPVVVPQVGSLAVGAPNNGRLVNGVQLPASGPDWIGLSAPHNRWTTDRMLTYLLAVLRDYRLANPGAPQVMIGDLSLPFGGQMAGHMSHRNGLDADVFYPRRDRRPRAPTRVRDVDRALAQDLVSRFVAAGAQFAFVGLRVGLGGPPGIVQPIRNHDDHVHVRIANMRR
ncbi:MAG: penicillin-insensitive murein endopeptidase [Actinomycetota bacterium]|nr:penicillin-insensitive murein endopeptidase [Actinomycetota bacterium]